MQKLWRSKIDWDECISNELHTLWREYECKLKLLNNIEISRKVIVLNENKESKIIEIHRFSVASQKAYGTCIYIRSVSSEGRFKNHLLCSKFRVAPLNTLSIAIRALRSVIVSPQKRCWILYRFLWIQYICGPIHVSYYVGYKGVVVNGHLS